MPLESKAHVFLQVIIPIVGFSLPIDINSVDHCDLPQPWTLTLNEYGLEERQACTKSKGQMYVISKKDLNRTQIFTMYYSALY